MDEISSGKGLLEGLLGGGAGAASILAGAAKFVLDHIRKVAKEEADAACSACRESRKAALDGLEAKVEELSVKLSDGCARFAKLEQADSGIKIDLLGSVRDIAAESAKWREEIRREIISRDSIDGIILRGISDHCRNCPRESAKKGGRQ